MKPIEYLNNIIKLGFETGRGNMNAFNEIFGEEETEHDCKAGKCSVCPSKL